MDGCGSSGGYNASDVSAALPPRPTSSLGVYAYGGTCRTHAARAREGWWLSGGSLWSHRRVRASGRKSAP
jgi:hypothetical protein